MPTKTKKKPKQQPLYDAIAREANACYYVTTWDAELQEFTPQVGVPEGPYTLLGLREPIRRLKAMGYGCCRGDMTCVLVERLEPGMVPGGSL